MSTRYKFGFPTPTLEQLTLVRIGQRIVNNSGRFAVFPDRKKPYKDYDVCAVDSQFRQMTENLQVSRQSKRDIFVMCMGMYDQHCNWLDHTGEDDFINNHKHNVEPMFDVNGILDEVVTWHKYFQKVTRGSNVTKEHLKDMLQVACRRTLFPEIGKLLRKILELEVAGAARLVGPRKNYAEGKVALSYTYSLSHVNANGLDKRALYEIFCWLNETHWMNVSFVVTERGMKIMLDHFQNVRSLKEYICGTMVGPAKLSFDFRAFRRWIQNQSAEFLLVVTELYTKVDVKRKLLSGWDESLFTVEESLKSFLRWPFTRLFLPLVALLNENVKRSDCTIIFRYIVDKIPENREFDVFGYGHLLLQFWNTFPSDLKQEFRTESSETSDYHFADDSINEAMKRLLKKNAIFHSLIVQSAFS